jgi:hypothetical protein
LISSDICKSNHPDTIVCLEDSDFWEICFSDILDMDNVELTTPQKRWSGIKSRFAEKLCRFHHSWRVNSIINLPLKGLWDKYDFVCNVEVGVKRWLFTDTSVRGYDRSALKKLREKHIKLHLLFLNPMISSRETEYALQLVKEDYFDLVYTVDKDDASEYGFNFTNAVYSKRNITNNHHCSNWKVSYVGAAKNRLPELHAIAAIFEQMKSIFYINGVKREERCPLSNVIYNHAMDYAEVLRVVDMSDCIVEVLQKGQRGFTFRTYETICYNKKLITNNVDIKECEFYNPRYIKIYSEIDDELIDFIENNTMPDYQYDGRYSPVNLYNDILRRERNEESYN